MTRVLIAFALVVATGAARQAPPAVTAFTNARVLTATGASGLEFVNSTMMTRDGKIASVVNAQLLVIDGKMVGLAGDKVVPSEGRVLDLQGKFVVPGFISAHAHVSDVNGLKSRAYTEENTRRQLGVFARYGITTVWSLGGEQAPAFALRDAQGVPTLDRARIFVAGDVITGRTPDEARAAVARVAALNPDVIKIRVDDNLGTATKMTPEVYRAVIEEAHARKLRVAAHIFYLEDAKDLVRSGVDIIAHSVRDKEFDS
jgi:imidazolonepropionase-like amidohydrolase